MRGLGNVLVILCNVCNEGDYQPFFAVIVRDFEAESQKYLKSGVFSSALGDAMLLGLSNVLQLPIVVFTSAESWPYFTVNPRMVPVDSNPIFLAYLQAGPGHYSLAVRKSVRQAPPPTPTSVTPSPEVEETCKTQCCRCGRGKNSRLTERLNCSTSTNYFSRCPCLRIKKPCTSSCSCKHCDNPFGRNSSTHNTGKARRKRQRHGEQELGRCTSAKFMKTSGEQPLCGRWTRTEHYVLLAILQCTFHNKECRNLDQLEIDQLMSEIYSTVVEVVVNNNILISLAPKTPTQIKAKLQQCIKEEQLLKECGSVNILPLWFCINWKHNRNYIIKLTVLFGVQKY